MSDTVELAFDAKARVDECTYELYSIANSLCQIGMRELSENLKYICACLESASSDALQAHNDLLSEAVKASNQASANMVLAALAATGGFKQEDSNEQEN